MHSRGVGWSVLYRASLQGEEDVHFWSAKRGRMLASGGERVLSAGPQKWLDCARFAVNRVPSTEAGETSVVKGMVVDQGVNLKRNLWQVSMLKERLP